MTDSEDHERELFSSLFKSILLAGFASKAKKMADGAETMNPGMKFLVEISSKQHAPEKGWLSKLLFAEWPQLKEEANTGATGFFSLLVFLLHCSLEGASNQSDCHQQLSRALGLPWEVIVKTSLDFLDDACRKADRHKQCNTTKAKQMKEALVQSLSTNTNIPLTSFLEVNHVEDVLGPRPFMRPNKDTLIEMHARTGLDARNILCLGASCLALSVSSKTVVTSFFGNEKGVFRSLSRRAKDIIDKIINTIGSGGDRGRMPLTTLPINMSSPATLKPPAPMKPSKQSVPSVLPTSTRTGTSFPGAQRQGHHQPHCVNASNVHQFYSNTYEKLSQPVENEHVNITISLPVTLWVSLVGSLVFSFLVKTRTGQYRHSEWSRKRSDSTSRQCNAFLFPEGPHVDPRKLDAKTLARKVCATEDFLGLLGDNKRHTILQRASARLQPSYCERALLTHREVGALLASTKMPLSVFYRLGTYLQSRIGFKLLPPNMMRKASSRDGCPDELVVKSEFEYKDLLKLSQKQGNKSVGKRQQCPTWQRWFPSVVAEFLVESSVANGSFCPSTDFSKIERAVIFVYGSDKAGDRIPTLLRLASRKGGNAGQKSAILAMVENCLEVHENLQAVAYNKEGRIYPFLQQLASDRLNCFVFELNLPNQPKQVECLILNLHGSIDPRDDKCVTKHPEVVVDLDQSIRQCPSVVAGDFPATVEKSYRQLFLNNEDKGRLKPLISPMNYQEAHGEELPPIRLKVHWLVDCHGNENYIKGCQIKHVVDQEENILINHRFRRGFRLPRKITRLRGKMKVTSTAVVGFPAEDTKQKWAVNGMMASAAQKHSCPICVQPTKEFGTVWPSWMCEVLTSHGQSSDILDSQQTQMGGYSERKDDFSLQSCYQRSLRATNAPVFCVQRPPLIELPPGKDPTPVMHVGQGVINHIISTMYTFCKIQIDQDGANILESIVSVKNDAIATMNNIKDEYDGKTSELRNLRTILSDLKTIKEAPVAQDDLQKRIAATTSDADEVAQLKNLLRASEKGLKNASARLERFQEQNYPTTQESVTLRIEEVARSEQYQHLVELRSGCIEVIARCSGYCNKSNPIGPATYAFMKAADVVTGKFRVEHGGMELSFKDGLTWLENFHEFSDILGSSYNGMPEHKEMKTRLQAALEVWNEILSHLTPVLKKTKSQQLWTESDIDSFKYHLAQFLAKAKKYETRLGKNGIGTPKLHMLAHHVVPFVQKFGMLGILSEEGFESFHQLLKRQEANLAYMGSAAKRTALLAKRTIAFIDMEEVLNVEKEKKSLDPGKQVDKIAKKLKRRRDKIGKPVYEGDFHEVDSADQGGICFARPALHPDQKIKREWMEVYNLVCRGKVPQVWMEAIAAELDEQDSSNLFLPNVANVDS